MKKKVIEGPAEPVWIANSPQDACLLQEALAVVEFVSAMSTVRTSLPLLLLLLSRTVPYDHMTGVVSRFLIA